MPADNAHVMMTPIETWKQNPRLIATNKPTITTPVSRARTNNRLMPAQQTAPQPVQRVSLLRTPVTIGGISMIKHTVTFLTAPNDQAFDKVNVHLVGYLGNLNPVEITAGTSPLTFVTPATGENVTLLVQPVGKSGQHLPITQATSIVTKL